jgi:hypothetical protein
MQDSPGLILEALDLILVFGAVKSLPAIEALKCATSRATSSSILSGIAPEAHFAVTLNVTPNPFKSNLSQ